MIRYVYKVEEFTKIPKEITTKWGYPHFHAVCYGMMTY